MKKFRDYLITKEVRTQKHEYYLSWVEQYMNFCHDASVSFVEPQSIRAHTLELKGKYKDWQVFQARQAVLYYIEWRNLISAERSLIKEFEEVLLWGDLSERTRSVYLNVVKRFLSYYKDLKKLGYAEVEAYVRKLSQEGSISLQNQVLSALSLFFREVLQEDLQGELLSLRAKNKLALPRIMNRSQIADLSELMRGSEALMVRLMYGSGLRSGECRGLRVRDFDFEGQSILVRSHTGEVRRSCLMPKSLMADLRKQLIVAKNLYKKDRARAMPGVLLPRGVEGELSVDFGWFWVFPKKQLSEVESGEGLCRKSISEYSLRKAFVEALSLINYPEMVSLDILRHSFAVHLLEDGCSLRRLQELMGHRDLKRVMIYEKMARMKRQEVRSPLDGLDFVNQE